MTAMKDLSGQRFGKLVVLSRADDSGGRVAWLCRCDCGSECVRVAVSLTRGATSSCGCNKKLPNAGHFKVTNGSTRGAHAREYRIWSSMKQRTSNPRAHAYQRYGGAGVKMHPEWAASFEVFLADVGPAPSAGHSIDRIDGSLGYEPGNVRWATPEEQNTNRRTVRHLVVDGVSKRLPDWCREYGADPKRVWMRVFKYGWSHLDALKAG